MTTAPVPPVPPVPPVIPPTQVRRPWRTVVRSVFQALVGLAAIAPLIAAGIEEATGYDLDGVPFIVVVLAAMAAITRVMAIPQVELWLKRFLPFLAAQPRSVVPATELYYPGVGGEAPVLDDDEEWDEPEALLGESW